MANKKKKLGWIIQFMIGALMIIWFWIMKSVINNIDSYLNQGILIGMAGMLLFWGMREVIGALAKQYSIIKKEKK